MNPSTIPSVTSGNITGAAIFAQFSIVIIMAIGASVLRRGEKDKPFYYGKPRFSALGWKILFFCLLTIGVLLMSDEFSKLWRPVFRDPVFPSIPWRVAILVMFIFDILCVTILVWNTGGSRDSAFSPLFFLLPTLAILLREPLIQLILYMVVTIISFTVLLVWAEPIGSSRDIPKHITAYWIVSITCFILTITVGYLTGQQN